MIDLGGKPLLEIFVKYEKNSCRSFLMPKSDGLTLNVCGWLKDAGGKSGNITIELGGQALSEIFVIGWRPFSVPKSGERAFGLKRVEHTLNASLEAGWRTLLVDLKI